jgi:hypothetical protein
MELKKRTLTMQILLQTHPLRNLSVIPRKIPPARKGRPPCLMAKSLNKKHKWKAITKKYSEKKGEFALKQI